ncbi:MAG TPA: alpha/beta hydrolase [Candidatus Saccharimonadales bacterium]|nr:alpha/beta hydrolase [Candidatus Saccharimonadales bacterium]
MHTVQSKDGTTIAYDKTGQGPALILVPAAFMDRQEYKGFIPELSDHFTVYNYDRRGRGDSGDTQPYSTQREVEDLAAVIETAGGEAYIYGQSSGAALTLLAASSGIGITKIAVFEPPFSTGKGERELPAGAPKHLMDLMAKDKWSDTMEYFLTKLVGIPAPAVAGMKSQPMWEGMRKFAHSLPYDAALTAGPAGDFLVPKAELAKIKIPTIAIDGGASWGWILETTKAVADAIDGAQYRTLPGQDHGVDPKVIAPVLIEFFGA